MELLVPGGGIEPPQGFWPLRILSPLRLPISPSRLRVYSSLATMGKMSPETEPGSCRNIQA